MFGIIGQLALSDDGIYFPNNKLTRDVTFGQISPRIQAALSQVSKGAEAFSFELFTVSIVQIHFNEFNEF